MPTVYEMMMSIGLDNKASSGLATISKELINVAALSDSIAKSFGGWGVALGTIGTILAAGAIVRGLEDIGKAGIGVNKQLELMKGAGMSAEEIQTAQAAAMLTTHNVLTTTYAENLKHINELRMAFGESTTAIQHLDEISKANTILNAMKGGKGGHDQIWELVKSLEQKGLTYDNDEFNSYVNTMMKAVEASGGRVTPSQFMQTFKYGRTSMLGWDEEFVGGALPRLIQSMSTGGGGAGGSGGPGMSLMSAYRSVVSNRMSKTSRAEFEDMGLMDEKGVKGSDLFMKNPYEWVQQTLMPALAAKGITEQNAIIAEIGKMFEKGTASSIMTEMGLQGRFHEGANSPFEKDIRLNKGAMGMPFYDELLQHDYATIMAAFNAQFKTLLETLGGKMMDPNGPVIAGLSKMTAVMAQISKWADDHPDAMNSILIGMAGIAAAFVALGAGAVLIGAAALLPGGAVTIAATTLASIIASFGGIAAANRGIDGMITNFNKGIDFLVTGLNDGVTKLLASLNPVMTAISQFIDWIGSIVASIGKFFDLSQFLKHKTNFEGSGPSGGGGGVLPANFTPGNRPQTVIQNNLSLNIDGRQLAQAMSDAFEDLYNHPTGAPAPNGWNSFRSVDGNITGT